MTTPSVQYVYADGSNNTIRPTAVVYPNGRTLHASYGSPGGMDDAASRVAALIDDDGTTHLADYSYLGLGSPVVVDYPQPQIQFTLVGTAGGNDPDTGDIYHGLDRFGRIKDAYWRNYGNSTDSARIQYGYDRASNRTYRHDVVATAQAKLFDELYGYDSIQRLQDMARGTLDGGRSALTTESFAQCWTLDPTGNWKGFREDDTGNGTWDLVQARAANAVNEITNITNTTGPAWAQPAYNPAGNMTTIPQPNDPAQYYTATYDAWNRLVKLVDTTTTDTVSEYAYDGAKRRILQNSFMSGVLSETRHYYYTEPSLWQVLEERLGASPDSADADRQFAWGQRYIDDLILRERDTNSNGTLDERLYALQDANWNTITLADPTGDITERFAYTAYGMPFFLDASFIPQSSSASDWENFYCGYRYESATALYHVRHRVLHTTLGIWLTRDAFGYTEDDHDLYQYALSNPANILDPSGELPLVGRIRRIIRRIRNMLNRLCTIFNAPNPALSAVMDAITCACFGFGVADLFNRWTPPGVSEFIEMADCLCNVITTAQTYCKSGFISGSSYALLTIADCMSGSIGVAIGATIGSLWGLPGALVGAGIGLAVGDPLLDTFFFALQNKITQGTWLPVDQTIACCNTAARMGCRIC